MFSFANENASSLTAYFHEALRARNKFVVDAAGSQWAAQQAAHMVLGEMFAPVLGTCQKIETGLHAHAFMFDRWVVKTNLFGQYYHDGQRQWLEWSYANQENPLAPKIAFLVSDPESDRFLVVMERLACHSGFRPHMFRERIDNALKKSFDQTPDESFPSLTAELIDIKRNSELAVTELVADIELMQEIGDADIEHELTVSLQEHEVALEYIKEIEMFWLALRTVHVVNFEKVRAFWDTLTAKMHVIDMHSLNWMIRSNGDPVLLDPVN